MKGKFKFNRRNLFFYAALGAISFFVSYQFSKNIKGFSFAFSGMHNGHLIGMENKALGIFNQDYTLLKKIELPFVPHSSEQNPHNLNQLLAVTKDEKMAAVIDLNTTVVKLIKLPDELEFSGHGFFLPNKTDIAFTVIDKKDNTGELHFYNEAGIFLKKYSTKGHSPHVVEVDLFKNDQVIIANLDSLVWLSIEDGTLIKKREGQGLKHFSQGPDKNIYIHGIAFSVYNAKKDTIENKSSKWNFSFKGEILNLFIDLDYERLWATLPQEDTVLVLNPQNFMIEKNFKIARPKIILPIQKSDRIYVTAAKNVEKRYFSRSKIEALDLKTSFKLDNLGFHATKFKRP